MLKVDYTHQFFKEEIENKNYTSDICFLMLVFY